MSQSVAVGAYVLFSLNPSKPPFIGRVTAIVPVTKGDTQLVTVAFERLETRTILVTKTVTLPTSLLAHVPGPGQANPTPFSNGALVALPGSSSEHPIIGKVEGDPEDMKNDAQTVKVVFEAPQPTTTIITTTATLPLSALCTQPDLATSILAREPFPYGRFFNAEDVSLTWSGDAAQPKCDG